MGTCHGYAREANGKSIGIDTLLNKASRAVCKIITNGKLGTGFFIKIYMRNYTKFFLMSNEHVIDKNLIENKEIIEIHYDYGFKSIKIKLDNNERLINEYKTNYNLDVTTVEILKEDNINDDYFLLPYLKDHNIKIGDKIYIPHMQIY